MDVTKIVYRVHYKGFDYNMNGKGSVTYFLVISAVLENNTNLLANLFHDKGPPNFSWLS